MPKTTPLISNDIVLREFDTLAGTIRLIPNQVSMIMGITMSQLEVNRSKGHALPYVKEGGKILYRVEDVRNYLRAQPDVKRRKVR
jgi:hypothetical protein